MNIVKIKKVDSVFYPLYCLLRKIKFRFLIFIPKKLFAQKSYRKYTGLRLNLENPVTYDEKLWWMKLNYRNPLMTICSDKFKVREYVKDKGLDGILNELYGVYYSVSEIDLERLPEEFFLKCNHISGWNLHCKKQNFSYKYVRRQFEPLFRINYYHYSREWNYKYIKPCIIAEKVLKSKTGAPLLDYKFMCFSGEPKLLFLDIGVCNEDGSHAEEYYRNIYDMDFKPVNMKETREHYDYTKIEKPQNFEYMIECARILSQPFLHCRVDLYNVDGKVIFGEITFYHGSGNNNIQPRSAAVMMGDWIELDKINSSICH